MKAMNLKSWVKFQANSHNEGSYTNKLRRQRMQFFENFFEEQFDDKIRSGQKIDVIDIGGTYDFWKAMNFKYFDECNVTLVNLKYIEVPDGITNVTSVEGDACNLERFSDNSFDIAFSNSCIEHIGKYPEWEMMANEMQRVSGGVIYLQTPNRYFPIEPHFLFPLFQFFPIKLRAFLICHFQLGFWTQGKDWDDSMKIADEIHLLTYKDLKQLFPWGVIKREKVLFLTKSFMVFANCMFSG